MKRITIIGGGITGLSAVYELEKRTTDAEIHLYEASNTLGGKIQTLHDQGSVIEQGPDCFFADKPGAIELVKELGLEQELIEPKQNHFSMLIDGTLHPIERGLVRFTDLDQLAIEATPFLSQEGKKRALSEREQPQTNNGDESIRDFFTRRFGTEYSRLIAEPLLAGTHGGDPETLSMRALFPSYLELEKKYGSLAASPSPKKPATFLSFRNGMHTLVDALAESLKRTVMHLSASDQTLDPTQPTLIAIPAPAARHLLEPSHPELSALLAQIPHRSAAIASFLFQKSALKGELHGTGFLTPYQPGQKITGATWSSHKWSSRTSEDHLLLRVFLNPGDDLLKHAEQEICRLLKIEGTPLLARLDEWHEALPQYRLGHQDLLQQIDQYLVQHPNLYLTGTSYRGVGIPDSIRQGRETAISLANLLA